MAKLFRGLSRLLFTASLVPNSTILVTMMEEALSSSETSVLTRTTLRNIPEDTILHNNIWQWNVRQGIGRPVLLPNNKRHKDAKIICYFLFLRP
jgi:hypothetical protein